MVAIEAVRASNAELKRLNPGLVALFVGATNGIGESSLEQFALHTTKPNVYFVGRSEASAARITDELKKLNPEGTFTFLQADVSLLKNVDDVCAKITAKEKKMNLVFLSPGYLTIKGRDESPEGLDRKFAVNYYSRFRFIHNMLPLLSNAASSNEMSRVIAVLAAGREGKLIEEDLDLKTHFSLRNCEAHTATMTALAIEELAKQYPGTGFVHTFPGFVDTNIMGRLPLPIWAAAKAFTFLLKPFTVPIVESGERNLFMATNLRYPPKNAEGAAGTKAEEVAVGSDGVKGSGAYLLNWNGERTGKDGLLREYRGRGVGRTVWEHTLEMFKNSGKAQ